MSRLAIFQILKWKASGVPLEYLSAVADDDDDV